MPGNKKYVLALDQGTTSSRAIVFDHDGGVVSQAHREFRQILPGPGLVEHDPEDIWTSQLETARQALAGAGLAGGDLAAVGLANQRETTVVWDRASGRPVANAIVWQSRVSAGICDRWRSEGLADVVRDKTGLLIDAYFSASKIRHLLDTLPGLRNRAERGEVLFGTVDTYLAWRLTNGRRHVTDASNASRTLLYNIHSLEWDEELLRLFGIPRAMLPEVRPSSEVYGDVADEWLEASVPLAGIAGDQQAATFGQACFEPGAAKNTYGTGAFLLMNTGQVAVRSSHNLLTTIGWQLGPDVVYCLEGSVFVAGAAVQWLRDGLGIIPDSAAAERLAATVPDCGGVYFVPAFVGLGAPYWDPAARGTILGITRGTSAAHLARAAIESMAFQSRDVLEAMEKDAGLELTELKVDGGASVNDALMQFQADLLGREVVRPVVAETTALGAAYLAGLAVGFWQSPDDVATNWQRDRVFRPTMQEDERARRVERWHEAVRRSLTWAKA